MIGRLVAALALAALALAPAGQSTADATRRLTRVPVPVGTDGRSQELYTGSYALLVGVSRYDTPAAWASLDGIPGELNQLADALRAAGFDRVQQATNPTGLELRRAVEDFIGTYGYIPGNRLVFYFSGHGHTLDKGARGYFVPRDAPDPLANEPGFRRAALSMDQVATWARDLVARHALFSFDSCFSGTIFRTRDRAIPQRISEITAKPVRQFMSAGGAGEPVPARSVYTPVFIRGLKGEADLDKDGFVTGTELGNYVQREVIAYKTRQTPQFGKIRDPDLDEGDVVFAVGPSVAPPPSAPAPPPATTSRITFSTGAGLLLVRIKPDRTAQFEDLARRLTTGLRSASDNMLRQQGEALRFYKAREPIGQDVLYVAFIDSASPDAEYSFFLLLSKTMTQSQLYASDTQERFRQWSDAFAAGMNKLSLTRLAGRGRSSERSETAAAPAATPRIAFTDDAGMLLIQIKPDQAATFEEFVRSLNARLLATSDPILRRQAEGYSIYRASEPLATGTLMYVVLADPALKGAEYELVMMQHRLMTPAEQGAPETAEMFKRFVGAFGPGGYNKLNLAPLEP